MTTNLDVQSSLFVYAKDAITGKVTRIAAPADMQIGLLDRPAELQLLGRLSLSVATYDVNGEQYTYIATHDTIALINLVTAPTSGVINVKLPSDPRKGQLYVIKDISATANITSIAISSSTPGVTINGATTLTLSDQGSSVVLFWSGSEWSILVSGGSFSSGGSGDTGASYVVISLTSSLANERVLAVAGGELTLSDGGANNNVTLGLETIPSVAGSYTTPNLTVDSKGRITTITNGTGGGADVSASYVTIGNTGSLPNERALAVSTGELTMTVGGAGGSVTLGLPDTGVTAQTYQYAFFAVDAKGRITSASIQPTPAPATGAYLLVAADVGLPTARTITNGVGLLGTDTGPGGSYNININNNIVATVSGTRFTGPVSSTGGLTGTLHNLISGISYLAAGSNITIVSQSNGQVRIAATTTEADRNASYVVLALTSSLPNERVLTPGTGLLLSDGGANGNATLSINNNVVATVSGTQFTGPVSASGGLSGSLQNIGPNLTYLVAGDNVTITTQSNGQVVIGAATTAGSGDAGATYLVLSSTSSLDNERVMTAGTGLRSTDGGANSTYTLAIDDNVVATVSGTRFLGGVSFASTALFQGAVTVLGTSVSLSNSTLAVTGNAFFLNGLSGSHTRLINGTSYLVAGDNVSIITQSNGQVRIAASEFADPAAAYILVGTTSSLSNERALAGGTGIRTADGGANGNFTLSINDTVVATVSGTRFTGPVRADGGLSGSLQLISTGLTYLAAGPNVSIATQSNGQVIISAATEGGFGDPDATYLVLGTTSSLSAERVLVASTGLTLNDGGANGNATLSINNNVVATVSGTRFTGPVSASAGLSGSLQMVGPTLTYLAAGDYISIVSQSNGQIRITNTSPAFDADATFIVLSTTASLANERTLAVGTGLLMSDSGANLNVTLSINNNVVATVSGTRFTGPVSSTGGLTGTLHNLISGISYIAGGDFISVVSQSNGQLRINSTAPGFDAGASYVVIATTSSLTNERALAGALGQIYLTDGGANGNVTINLSTTGVVTGTYTYPTLTVDPRGRITSITNGITPAPQTASYIVVGTDAALTNERTLDAGLGLTSVDGGPNATFSININNNVVATISGSTFTGPVSASGGLSGSLQLIAPGLPYLVGEGTVTVTTQSNGQVVISSFGGGGGGADVFASYVVVGNTSSLPNERQLAQGTGLILTDGGANGTISFSINDNVVATVSGTQFTGPVSASAGLSGSLQMIGPNLTYLVQGDHMLISSQSNGQVRLTVNSSSILDDDIVATVSGTRFTGNVVATTGLSGSLQRLANGLSYLVEGDNVTITSQSNGQVIIAAGGDRAATYLVMSTTASLLNERVATAGTGIRITDGGANGNATFFIDDNVVATVSGTIFTGNVSASNGLSGSLQLVAPGLPYLVAGTNVDILTQSNGQVVISANTVGGGGGSGDPFASYVVIGLTSSLANERFLSASTSIKIFDNGANGAVYLETDNNVVATISGSTFTGPVSASAGLSGSLQRIGPNLTYLAGGLGISVVTQSNGQVVINHSFPQYQEIPILQGVERNDQDTFYAISAFELNLGGTETMIPSGATGYSAYFQPIIEIYPTGALGVARLWNVTNLSQVTNSVLTGTSLTPTRLRTANLTGSFATGSNIYELQVRLVATSSSEYRVVCKGAKLVMNWT